MPFFDFHIHPTLKCLFSDDDTAEGFPKLSPWSPLESSKIPFLLKWCSEFEYILQSQGNLAQLVQTDCNLVCIALYMPEKDILTAQLIQQSSSSSLKVYLQQKKIVALANGNPFQTLLSDDLVTLTTPAKFDVTDRKVKLLQTRNDYQQDDASTINVVCSVEGCHTLSSALQHFDPLEIISNMDVLKSKVRVMSVNLTHMEQSPICNHAFGMQFLANDGFKPTGNKIGPGGVDIVSHCYRNKIMIDVKHMSLGARQHLYQLRGSPEFTPINQPIVCTHAGFTGISWNDIPKYIFNQRKFSAGYTVLWQGKPVKYGGGDPRPCFNASSINLYDEDIMQILSSGGMIGLSLDKRILGYQQFEELSNGRDDFPMETEYISNQELGFFFNTPGITLGDAFDDGRVLGWDEIEDGGVTNPDISQYHLRHFMAHILHIIVVSGKFGYDLNTALSQVCMGADFDGLINPVWICMTCSDLPAFKAEFIRQFPGFARDSKVNLPAGFDVSRFADGLFFENGRNFVLKRLDLLNS